MARYKHIDVSPRFLAVDLKRQLLPGTFEHALDHLLDHSAYVPARPGCTTPHIRFLFIAPQLRVRLPSDPTSR